MLAPNLEFETLLEDGFTSQKLRDWAKKYKMTTLRTEGIKKVIEHKTTFDEIIRVTT